MANPTGTFEITPIGPFSLEASTRFLEGFTPASYQGASAAGMRLAFIADGLDREERVAGALVWQDGESILIETYGPADPVVVRDQVSRILSLDVDGRGFPSVGQHDPVVGDLQQRYSGLRPVLFYSPYEAAAWSIIGQRIRITQAATIKARMAEQLGESIDVAGEQHFAFPGPSRLADLEAFPGLFDRKIDWLQALARAAKAGTLEANHLRSLPADQALKELKSLPGIGDFSAELTLIRGAGLQDQLPTHEARLARAVALAYNLDALPSNEQLQQLAERWRPYRTWVTILLRTMLEDETHEIG